MGDERVEGAGRVNLGKTVEAGLVVDALVVGRAALLREGDLAPLQPQLLHPLVRVLGRLQLAQPGNDPRALCPGEHLLPAQRSGVRALSAPRPAPAGCQGETQPVSPW